MTNPAPENNEPVITNETAPENIVVVPPAANDDEQKPAEAAPAVCATTAAPVCSKKKKILSAVFNMAAGAALTAGAKAAVTAAMIGCPPLAILLATSFTVGVVMTGLCHEGKRRQAKKENNNAPAFFSKQNAADFFNKQNAKTFAKSSLFAFAGGALYLGFHEGIIQNGWHALFGHTAPVVPDAPVVTVAPVETVVAPPVVDTPPVIDVPPPAVETIVPVPVVVDIPCPSPMEHFASLIQGHDVSDRVADALNRAASTNARVAAQGAKDLAYFSFNGFDGVPKDPTVALELFQKAADAGNTQAQIDMLYIQYHGLGGVTANPAAATAVMQQIHSPRAAEFVTKWTGHAAAKTLEAAQSFDSKAILQGIKFCP